MIFLYIILGIIALICIILALRVSLCLHYEKELCVYLRVFFVKIPILPDRPKKYKKKKEKKKDSTVTLRTMGDPKPRTLLDDVKMIREILHIFLKDFSHRAHVNLAKIHVRVGTPDAAQTAILYGLIASAIDGVVTFLEEITNLDKIRSHAISVEPDFLADRSSAEIKIRISISGFGAIALLFKTFFNYQKIKNRK